MAAKPRLMSNVVNLPELNERSNRTNAGGKCLQGLETGGNRFVDIKSIGQCSMLSVYVAT